MGGIVGLQMDGSIPSRGKYFIVDGRAIHWTGGCYLERCPSNQRVAVVCLRRASSLTGGALKLTRRTIKWTSGPSR